MTALEISGATKAYGRVPALRGVDLTVAAGEFLAILGPSGCGKTTLLRCVAGFERLDTGAVHLAGRLVDGGRAGRTGSTGRRGRAPVAPHRRRVAVVPQEGALFPHLSVADNVAYGLDRGPDRSARVDEVLTLVGLSGYGARMPHQLSGGQQQRVAAARALAPRPPLVLLDEPFNALDAGLRAELRGDIRHALRADGATAVLVTHDQEEALSVADRVAVMRDGVIHQVGTPRQVYRCPADPWIAGFVGTAVLLAATTTTDGASTALGPVRLAEPVSAGLPVTVLVRPEQIRVGPNGDAAVAASVVHTEFRGHDTLLTLRLPDASQVTARMTADDEATQVGATVRVHVVGPARSWDRPA